MIMENDCIPDCRDTRSVCRASGLRLIADCGSTKTDWAVCSEGVIHRRFLTSGFNAIVTPECEIERVIREEVAPNVGGMSFGGVFFYGAGCADAESCGVVERLLRAALDCGTVEVVSDLLGAARALFGDREGIACIFGTGSNSCHYDGRGIVENVSPLGFILGDEGSGAVMGRKLVGDILKRQLSPEICRAFDDDYGLSRSEIIRRVYREPSANRFLASFAPFLKRHISDPGIARLVEGSFEEFFRRNVEAYPAGLPVGAVGSIAHHFQPQLHRAATTFGRPLTSVIPAPLEALAAYHR